MRKIGLVLLINLFILTADSSAEIIYLKNGETIEGEIIQRKKTSIRVMINNIPVTYFMDEIEKIEDEPTSMTVEELQKRKIRPYAKIPNEKIILIEGLMDANGAKMNMEQRLLELLAKVPPEEFEYYRMMFQVDEIVERLIPLYDKYYTKEELKGLIQFYSSPLGKKLINVTPYFLKEVMVETIKYFQEQIKVLNK